MASSTPFFAPIPGRSFPPDFKGLVRRVRYRRSAKTSTTMITMTTIVPIPIYTVIPLIQRLQFIRCYPLRAMQTIRPALCPR